VTDEFGVAIIGAGYWGPNLIRNFASHDGWDLRWVCDLDEERARRTVGKRSLVRTTDNFADVLDDPGVQAIAIATPPSTHSALAIEAIDSGRHVLVEKPLASSVAEGEKMVALAEEHDVVLMCDHIYCYTPVVRYLRDVVRAGEIGDIQYVDSVRINLGLVQHDTDVFWDLAPHDLSILDFVLPEHTKMTAVSAWGSDPIGAGQSCVGYMNLPLSSGGIAHIHVNWLSPVKIRQTIVGGSQRMVVWDDLNPAQRLSMYDKGVELAEPAPEDERRAALISYRSGDMIAPGLREHEALQGVVSEFHEAIAERRPALTDGDAGLRVLRVLEATAASTRRGGSVVELDS
jgi:predicted dehydrogenase